MGIDDLVGQAKDFAKDHEDQVDQGVDKGAELAKDKIEGHDDQIDGAVDKVKGLLD